MILIHRWLSVFILVTPLLYGERIALVYDGEGVSNHVAFAEIRQEVSGLLDGEFTIDQCRVAAEFCRVGRLIGLSLSRAIVKP